MFKRLIPCLPLSLVLFALGCGPPGNAAQPGSPATEVAEASATNSQPGSPAGATPFQYDEVKGIVSLNTQMAPGQRRRFDLGQGSITLETRSADDDKLTFHYIPEVEGGYTVYECTVPVSPTPVEIKINSDGTPGETSFDLAKCKVIRRGNLHLP
jgi:hypothetical protein